MMASRRAFFRRASGLIAPALCALFIPADRLDFGVPRQVVAPEREWLKIIGGETWAPGQAAAVVWPRGIYTRAPSGGDAMAFEVEHETLPSVEWRMVNQDYIESTGILSPHSVTITAWRRA